MTNVKKLLVLLSDGKRRTRAQMAKQLGLTVAQTETVIRTAMAAKNISSFTPPPSYQITEPGRVEAAREPLTPEMVMRKRNERLRRRRAEASGLITKRATVPEANVPMLNRATSGAIPNSVFALGRM